MEQRAVGQPGQRIMVDGPAQLGFGALAILDIGQRPDHVRCAAVGITRRRGAAVEHPDPAALARSAAHFDFEILAATLDIRGHRDEQSLPIVGVDGGPIVDHLVFGVGVAKARDAHRAAADADRVGRSVPFPHPDPGAVERARQAHLRFGEIAFGHLARVDVGQRADIAKQGAVGGATRLARTHHPPRLPVGPANAEIDLKRFLRVGDHLQRRQARQVIGEYRAQPAHVERLRLRLAGEVVPASGQIGRSADLVGQPDHRRHVVRQILEAYFAFGQRDRREAPLVDVFGGAVPADDVALRVAVGERLQPRPSVRSAVEPARADLDIIGFATGQRGTPCRDREVAVVGMNQLSLCNGVVEHFVGAQSFGGRRARQRRPAMRIASPEGDVGNLEKARIALVGGGACTVGDFRSG